LAETAGIGSTRDKSAIGQQLFERYHGPLFTYFRRRTRASAEAEDLVQEVIRRMMERDDIGGIEAVDAFIFATARNLLKDRARRDGVRDRAQAEIAALSTDIEVLHPERVIQGKQDLARVMAALAQLDETPRDMFILHRLDGMKQRDIAEAYGMSLSSVEKHLRKTLLHLMRSIEL
jgi:RNA polymerase sigma-70 factor (ECF subfamily)